MNLQLLALLILFEDYEQEFHRELATFGYGWFYMKLTSRISNLGNRQPLNWQLLVTVSFRHEQVEKVMCWLLRYTPKFKEIFKADIRRHWDEYREKMLQSFVACRIGEKAAMGVENWESREKQRKEAEIAETEKAEKGQETKDAEATEEGAAESGTEDRPE